jgi:pimeloyl-ACP methyl ester carboxylesterase
MKLPLRVVGAGVTLAIAMAWMGCAAPDPPAAPQPPARHAALAGRYAIDPFAFLEVGATGDLLSVVPPFWGSKPYFVSENGRHFLMHLPSPRPNRTATFMDFDGEVPGGLTLSEVDRRYDGKTFRRLQAGDSTVEELLLQGKIADGVRLALEASQTQEGEADTERLADFSQRLLLNCPARMAATAGFLGGLTAEFPEHSRLQSLYAYALVAAGRRPEGEQAFVKALQLDPDDQGAEEGLRRLRFQEPPAGQGYRATVPFSISEAYAVPTDAEIERVRQRWSERDLSPQQVATITTETLELAHGTMEARVIRHEVHGDVHFGTVFVPPGAAPGSLAVVIDARGVNPTYTPHDISAGTKTLTALGPPQRGFAFLVPGFRGNTQILNGNEYVSGGDASDAWDGATDDALAFLNAALSVTPEADPDKVAIIGYSRGGTVALLAGERDDRIDLVLNVVGPVDHFVAMDSFLGFTEVEVLADALREGTIPTPTEEGGQNWDHFFDRIEGGESLADARARMIASSPLYFAEDLPETHSYYGAEDRSVPLANPTALRERLAELGRLGRDATVQVFERRGHDTDPLLVQQATAKRLIEWAASGGS